MRDGDMLVPDAGEQRTVRRILDLRGGGMSYDRIAKQLNADGVTGKAGDDIEGAAAALWEALADCDGPSAVMAARARRYAEDPPSEDWDGVFFMAEK